MHRLAVFASGSGTNFEAIVQACEQGVLNARVVLMVCDKPGARVVERVETFVFSPKAYGSKADFEREIVALLDAAGVELVCLAGYMRIVGDTLLEAYGGRIINVHPSLLPAFRGAHAIERRPAGFRVLRPRPRRVGSYGACHGVSALCRNDR